MGNKKPRSLALARLSGFLGVYRMDYTTSYPDSSNTQGQTSRGDATPPCFCDWLDVTFPPSSDLWGPVSDLLSSVGGRLKSLPNGSLEYRFPELGWGNIQFSTRGEQWCRLSASGGSLAHLRASGAFEEYLSLLGSSPHRITRLDATLDVSRDGADSIAYLRGKYPGGTPIYLTRKGLGPTYLLSPRKSDGRETGTMYIGHRSRARVTARVYDKAQERLDRVGLEIPPTTRYEVTVKSDVGATLRDAAFPAPIFYHFASPSLLPLVSTVPGWVPSFDFAWESRKSESTPYERLSRRVVASVEIDELCALADSLGDAGRLTLLRLLRSRIGLRDITIAA